MRKLGLALGLFLLGLVPAQPQAISPPTPPVSVNGAYNVTPPTCVDKQGCWLQVDVNGRLLVVGSFTPSGSSPEFTPVAPATATATKGVLGGCQYDSTQKTLTDGQQAAVSCTNRGAYLVATGADAFTVVLNAETTKVIGAVNQGTSPWVVSGIQLPTAGALTTTSITVTSTSGAFLGAAAASKFLLCKNESTTASIALNFANGTAVLNTAGNITLTPGASIQFDGTAVPTGAITGISSAASSPATCLSS